MIDAHHHFWIYRPNEFDWLTDDMEVLRMHFLPADLQAAVTPAGVTGVITVHAKRTREDTAWLLALAAQDPFIKGVVGWVPLKDPELGVILDQMRENPHFRGVREIIQGAPDEEFFTCPDFNRGIRELTVRHLPFDLLIFHDQLPSATRFVDQHPNQQFILDHIAKPEIRSTGSGAWDAQIRELAKRPNVCCKFSGVVTEVREEEWSIDLLRPFFETALEAFGSRRFMFGSDWPVCLLRTDYTRWADTVKELAGALSADESDAFFSQTAQTAYALPVRPAVPAETA
ncbi:amidohydrolase family protein [soil metagenome]